MARVAHLTTIISVTDFVRMLDMLKIIVIVIFKMAAKKQQLE